MLPHNEIRILLECAYCLLFLACGAYLSRDKAMRANDSYLSLLYALQS